MSNRIEIEAKYFCEDEDKLNELINREKMQELENNIEIDEYFTDIDSQYIKNRTCLRIRRTNNRDMELTFKGKSNVLNSVYAKKESNIKLDISEYKDVIEFLSATGYYSYVEVYKKRKVYTKKDGELVYNIMVDNVKNVGSFIEFEILCDDENKSLDILSDKLNAFVLKFKELNMKVADLPYRDFVAQKIYDKITYGKTKDTLLLDLDGTLIDSEKEFFYCFRNVIYKYFNYEISLEEYIDNELKLNANLINYLKNKKVVPKEYLDEKIMNYIYDMYENKFKNVIYNKDTLVNFELLKKLKNNGIKLSLVTTCKSKFINILMNELKINNLFDCIVSRDDVKNLKPDSEAYNMAINTLKVDKDRCLAIEDSYRGLISAKKIGVDTILVDKYSLDPKEYYDVFNGNSFSKVALIILNNYK